MSSCDESFSNLQTAVDGRNRPYGGTSHTVDRVHRNGLDNLDRQRARQRPAASSVGQLLGGSREPEYPHVESDPE